MSTKSLYLLGSLFLAAAALQGQTPVYYSATQPDCSSLGTLPVAIRNASSGTLGYSCYMSGTFVWYAAGGGWGTSIRVAAPASGAIGVDYSFYDQSGDPQSLDTRVLGSPSTGSGNDFQFALLANQPAEINLLGLASTGPNYTEAKGSVYAVIYCPDAKTCSNATPQLLYSAQPYHPWSLSVPIVWDQSLSSQWSAEGVDDGTTNLVSLVVYNAETTAATYTVRIYDSKGTLAGTGITPSIPPLQSLADGYYGEGGTMGVLLSEIVSPLPSGLFKILVDGGTMLSAVEVLQFNGSSATAPQVAKDTAPSSSSSAASVPRLNVRNSRKASMPKSVFSALTM
jgi:hypothetical protein